MESPDDAKVASRMRPIIFIMDWTEAEKKCSLLISSRTPGKNLISGRLVPSKLRVMPELPDITIYIEALERRVQGQVLDRVRVSSPFLLRSAVPPLASIHGQKISGLRRMGKRIVFGFENDCWLVLHLMIAGRLHWKQAGVKLAGKQNLA